MQFAHRLIARPELLNINQQVNLTPGPTMRTSVLGSIDIEPEVALAHTRDVGSVSLIVLSK